MSYLGELRGNLRPLLAASLGSGAGLLMMAYTSTIFGPYLLSAFGWSRAQFALIGLSMLSTLLALPFIGRLTDRIGVRRAALVGALGIPACLTGYSLMNGNFGIYFVISCAMLGLGSFTSPVVYTRLIAADFRKAQGLALTVVTISPALFGAIAAPVLTHVIDLWGWRVGYRALAAFVLVCSLTAVALIPPHDAEEMTRAAISPARADFRQILRSRQFWIVFAAMVLCTLPTPLQSSQMGLMLRDNHLGSAGAAMMISVFSIGTIAGRLACGLALDRFSAPVVAAISMLLPAIGFALLATPLDTTPVIGLSMFLVGVAFGAEGDLQSFLVARHFDLRIFSTTLSLVYVGVFAASATGAMLLSLVYKFTGTFDPFLVFAAGTVALGSLLFLLLPRAGHFAKIGGDEVPAETPAPEILKLQPEEAAI